MLHWTFILQLWKSGFNVMKCAYWMLHTYQTPGKNFHFHDFLCLHSKYGRELHMLMCFMTEMCNWDSAVECAARLLWEGNCACTATDILRSLSFWLPCREQQRRNMAAGGREKRVSEKHRRKGGGGVGWGGSVHAVLCQHAPLCQAWLITTSNS